MRHEARAPYRAHCIFCGRDAPAEKPRCPRCGGSLFLELDLDRPFMRPEARPTRVVIRGRRTEMTAKPSGVR